MSDGKNSGAAVLLFLLFGAGSVGVLTIDPTQTGTIPTDTSHPEPTIPEPYKNGEYKMPSYEPADGTCYIGIEQSDMTQTALTTWKTVTGKGVYIYAFFSGCDTNIMLSSIKTLCDNGYVSGVLISFNPSTGGVSTEQAIVNGDWDSYFTTLANTFKNFPYPKFIVWGGEMNGNWEPYGANSTLFKNAWIHVHNIFTVVGADVAWVFQPNQPPAANMNYAYGGREIIMNYYPGDAYVDWFSVSCHGASWIGFGDTVTEVMNYPYMTIDDEAVSRGKPFMFSEMGASANWQTGTPSESERATWLSGFFTYIINTDLVKAFVYYNFGVTGTNEKPLFDESQVLNAFKNGVANGKFVDSGAPPVLASSTVTSPSFSINPVEVNHTVTVNTSVAGSSGTPTGTVAFYYSIDGGVSWVQYSVKSLTSGSASASYTPQTVGTHYHKIVYNGDATYYSATSTSTYLYAVATPPITPPPIQYYYVKIQSGAGGSTNPVASGQSYQFIVGDVASVVASANQNYTFWHWLLNGAVSTTNLTISIFGAANTTYIVQPEFTANTPPTPTPTTWTLTSSTQGTGSMTPTSSTQTDLTILLTATAGPGYVFDSFIIDGVSYSDNPHSLTSVFGASHTVVAVFTPASTPEPVVNQQASTLLDTTMVKLQNATPPSFEDALAKLKEAGLI
jgi:hypothetical protein